MTNRERQLVNFHLERIKSLEGTLGKDSTYIERLEVKRKQKRHQELIDEVLVKDIDKD